MLQQILSNIISNTFEQKIGRWQNKKENKEAMYLSFRLNIDYEKENGYRWLHIMIYAPTNHVGVIARKQWNVYKLEDIKQYEKDSIVFKTGKEYIEGFSKWKKYSYHDLHWKNGVDTIIKKYKNQLTGIEDLGKDWFDIEIMTPNLITNFEKTIKKVPKDYCHEDKSENDCIFCHKPEERK